MNKTDLTTQNQTILGHFDAGLYSYILIPYDLCTFD